jgi:alkylated DNA nucleotide flippase Atl1
LDDLYLINKYSGSDDRWQKLLPSMVDRESWRKLVSGQVGADGGDRIGAAYRFFLNALREDEEDGLDIRALEGTIAGQLHVVQIQVESDDNVHRIFESLNDQNEKLSSADLLRNHVLMRLGSRMDEVYHRYWEPMEQIVSGKALDDLVALRLVLAGERHVMEKEVFHTLQAHLRRFPNEAAVEQWVAELHVLALMLRHLIEPATMPDLVVREAISRLVQWGGDAFRAIALRILTAHRDGALDSRGAAEALRVVESYLVRRNVADIDERSNPRKLRALVRTLGSGVPDAATLQYLLSGPEFEFPTDDQVRAGLEGWVYKRRGLKLAQILRCLERDYGSAEPVDMSATRPTIEHVLPQNPGQPWFDVLAADATGDETADDLHGMLVHTLGNLTMTGVNERLGNLPFDEKRKHFADSGFSMNREIALQARWGRPEIEARGAALADRALSIWPGPVTDGPQRVTPAPRTSSDGAPAVATAVGATPAAPSPAGPARMEPAPIESGQVEVGRADSVGPSSMGRLGRRRAARDRRLRRILARIPAGRWTSFAAIGTAVGINPAHLPGILFDGDFPNAHRVLKKTGVSSEMFRWPEAGRTEKQRDVLTAEGVRFNPSGHANASQYIDADELTE